MGQTPVMMLLEHNRISMAFGSALANCPLALPVPRFRRWGPTWLPGQIVDLRCEAAAKFRPNAGPCRNLETFGEFVDTVS